MPQPIYPVGAVDYLTDQHFQGNAMVPFRLGAYVSWKLYPAVKVSLDGRYEEVYSNEVMRQVFDFYDARANWRATLDAYPTDIVVAPRDSPICAKMRETEWNAVYEDKEFDSLRQAGPLDGAARQSRKVFRGSATVRMRQQQNFQR